MSVDCCGRSRSGAFCPECGRKLGDDPLRDLLEFCRKAEVGARRLANKQDRRSADHDVDDIGRQYYSRKAEASRRDAVLWKARGDALAALMGADDDTTRGDARS